MESGFLSKRAINGKILYFTSNSGLDFVKKYSDLLGIAKPLLHALNPNADQLQRNDGNSA